MSEARQDEEPPSTSAVEAAAAAAREEEAAASGDSDDTSPDASSGRWNPSRLGGPGAMQPGRDARRRWKGAPARAAATARS